MYTYGIYKMHMFKYVYERVYVNIQIYDCVNISN